MEFEDKNIENAIVKDIQYDPYGEKILHVDFKRISMDKKLSIPVAFEFSGTPKGALQGGKWEPQIREANVSCLPNQIPDKIHVNIENLDVGQKLFAKDIQLPAGVTVELAPDIIVGLVHAPKTATEPAAAQEARTEPERIVKPKTEKSETEE